MIFLRLSGGLGNQLYQLAAASMLSQDSNFAHQVIPLIEGLGKYAEPRSPDSLLLLEPNCWLLPPETSISTMSRWLTLSCRAGRWLPTYGISDRNIWKAVTKDFRFDRIVDGYFQQGWTHETFSRAIHQMPVRPINSKEIERIDRDEVIVHIRGGDFLRLQRFKVVNEDFYVKAAQQAIELGFKRFAIMTDDVAYAGWVRDHMLKRLSEAKIRMIPRADNIFEDFDTLRAATARIIGNSTFAWWATALGSSGTPTWAPVRMTTDKLRDYYLVNEIPVIDSVE